MQTRAYRVIGVVLSVAGLAATLIAAQADELGVAAFAGTITIVANILNYAARQVGDSTTRTFPE